MTDKDKKKVVSTTDTASVCLLLVSYKKRTTANYIQILEKYICALKVPKAVIQSTTYIPRAQTAQTASGRTKPGGF